MTEPKSLVDVDDGFELQVRALQQTQAMIAAATGGASAWLMPDKRNWDGDLFDLVGIGKPFDRAALNEAVVKSITDREAPGVIGDLVSGTTQVDLLAIMERAFRARHTSRRPRLVAHRTGRIAGHGHGEGVLITNMLEYASKLVKLSRL